MPKRNTLNDLDDFLKDTKRQEAATETIEDYVEEAPHNLIDIGPLADDNAEPEVLGAMTAKDIALYIHFLAKDRNLSFTDVWLDVIAEGAKIEPLLKGDRLINTIIKANLTSLSVMRDGTLVNLKKLFKAK